MRRKKIVPAGMIACVLSGIILTAPVQETAGTPGQVLYASATPALVLYASAAKRATTKAQKKIKQNKKKAKKYIGKKLSSLVKAIGKYKKLSKAASCYYENEYDGIARYDGFVVYCHTENRKNWIVDSVE